MSYYILPIFHLYIRRRKEMIVGLWVKKNEK